MSNEFEKYEKNSRWEVCTTYGNSGRVIRFQDEHGNRCFNIGNQYHNKNFFWDDLEHIVKHFSAWILDSGTIIHWEEE